MNVINESHHAHLRWPRGVRPEDSLLLRRALRRLRMKHGLSLEQAGELLGITVGSVSRAQTGVRLPFTAARLARAFNVSIEEVLAACSHCGYRPSPGYRCLICGASELDLWCCPQCPVKVGTAYELNDHTKAEHPKEPRRAKDPAH